VTTAVPLDINAEPALQGFCSSVLLKNKKYRSCRFKVGKFSMVDKRFLSLFIWLTV